MNVAIEELDTKQCACKVINKCLPQITLQNIELKFILDVIVREMMTNFKSYHVRIMI